jgi:hypothetical protein
MNLSESFKRAITIATPKVMAVAVMITLFFYTSCSEEDVRIAYSGRVCGKSYVPRHTAMLTVQVGSGRTAGLIDSLCVIPEQFIVYYYGHSKYSMEIEEITVNKVTYDNSSNGDSVHVFEGALYTVSKGVPFK